MASYSQRRSGARNGARLAEQAIREEMARQAVDNRVQHTEAAARRKLAREAERVRKKMTADDLRGSEYVRDECGWHRVVRVSAKSVSVETPYSWTDRIPLDRILEARKAAA